jgi:ubiquinone/menaquinone biosynthesis C-methylase UbiE
MGIYGKYVLPRLLDFTMRRPQGANERRKLLVSARGEVLEIGFGTALNVAFYPRAVKKLVLFDRSEVLRRRVRGRIAAAAFSVEMVFGDAAFLPFDAARFDCVVSTWTLCSIANVVSALVEVKRVLKPDGQLLFVEHGRSWQPSLARRQARWDRWQQRIAGGCHLSRPIDLLVREAGLEIVELERFLLPDCPSLLAPHYRGLAQPP